MFLKLQWVVSKLNDLGTGYFVHIIIWNFEAEIDNSDITPAEILHELHTPLNRGGNISLRVEFYSTKQSIFDHWSGTES